ncbi:glutaredoxin family protein [Ottowia sp. VDI28]|uniref:glutaredoxin family protein n=1 Tax=Ottowia sp. VDI28 TaxID=3133968 RepID=UPI003C2AC27A
MNIRHSWTMGLTALLLAGAAQAQLYRSVGPDGRVTYSDKPPAANTSTNGAGAAPANRAGSGNASLPYQLRQIAERYPVTLYASTDCAPCNSGRNLLVNRGVPFTEKTISTNDDILALQRLTGQGSNVPLLTIGRQHLQGYSDADWSQYLDAAGYPKTSQLPSSYQRPAATPMVAVQPAQAAGSPASASAPEAAPTDPSVAPTPTETNPTGIRF